MTIQDKINQVNEHNPMDYAYEVGDRVRCIHCEEEFFAHELQLVEREGMTWILCKYYPECDGSILDMFDAEAWRYASGRYFPR